MAPGTEIAYLIATLQLSCIADDAQGEQVETSWDPEIRSSRTMTAIDIYHIDIARKLRAIAAPL
jgi:hypothetical protein